MSNELSQHSPTADTGGSRDEASHRLANVVARLPIEIWEYILDWIVFQLRGVSIAANREMVQRLSTCSLVCRAWRVRSQAHLFKAVTLNYEELASLDTVLTNNPAIRSGIEEMHFLKKSKSMSISFFVIRHQLSNLTDLNIGGLDLTREHQWFHRSTLFRSVQRLHLYDLQTCQLSQLIRFVNCFHSLYSLGMLFAFNKLEHKGQILPKPFHAETRSLTWLQLHLTPGVSRFIDWLLKPKILLAQLKALVLYVWNIPDETEFLSGFEGLERLLSSCRNSIEELKLRLKRVPMVESVFGIVRLDSFPSLTHLTYGSYGIDLALPYAVRQLEAVASKCKLVEVTFDISLHDIEDQLDPDMCRAIDDALTGGKFPSIESVYLHKTIAFLSFPKLCKAGLLKCLSKSYWRERQILPIDLCERIIDCVYCDSVECKGKWNFQTRRTLTACSLVCRAWRLYTETYLSEPVEVPYEELSSFGDALLNDRRISCGITGLEVVKKVKAVPISLFAIQRHLQLRNLEYLSIDEPDLTREHRWLHRAPLFRCVLELKLHRLQSCHLSQLVRFINAFPSLYMLGLDFAFDKLDHNGRILPKPCHINTRSLTWLELHLIPGTSRLIEWFLKAKPLLMHIETLTLYVPHIQDEDEIRCVLEGVGRLLDCCCNSVESFELQLESVSMAGKVSDLVELDAFPNLKYLTYGSPGKDFVIPYAVHQLDSVRSTCGLIEVSFDISLGHGNQPDQGMCEILDRLLTRDRFPSLQRVGLHRTITPELFPQLQKAQRLFVLKDSFWRDMPVINNDSDKAPVKDNSNIKIVEGSEDITEKTEGDDTS